MLKNSTCEENSVRRKLKRIGNWNENIKHIIKHIILILVYSPANLRKNTYSIL